MRALVLALLLALLLAGCQVPASTLTELGSILSAERPIEFVAPIWTWRF